MHLHHAPPPRSRMWSRERGAAAVEMAIVLPLLVLLLGGIVDFGRAFYTKNILTNAAREGARAASLSTSTSAIVTSRTNAALNGLTLSKATVTSINVPCTSATNAGARVTYQYDWIFLPGVLGLFGAGGALPSSLTAESQMRCVT